MLYNLEIAYAIYVVMHVKIINVKLLRKFCYMYRNLGHFQNMM